MPPDVVSPPDLAADLDDLRRRHGLPGLAWAVAPLDGPLLAGASGVRREGGGAPLALRDRLHLGSCTKPLTATLIATLIGEGLDWDTRAVDALGATDAHPAYRDATLAGLLSHASGLPPFTRDDEFVGAPAEGSPAERRAAFARRALRGPPAAAPGTPLYSNAGFGVAAAALEAVTGRAWEDLLRERVFAPLGLASGGVGWPARDRPDEPWGHRRREDRWEPHDPGGAYALHPGIAPAGDAHLDILDLAAFARDHLRGLNGRPGLLAPEVYAHLHDDHASGPDGAYGLGWGVQRYRGKRASSHAGSAETFLVLVLLLPDEEPHGGHAFAVATNAAGGPAHAGLDDALGRLVARFTSAEVGARDGD